MIAVPNSALLQLLLLGTPFWVLAFAALATTGRGRRAGRRRGLFRNRFALWGCALFLAAMVLVVLTMVAARIGRCSGGFIDPVTCLRWPDEFGAMVMDVGFVTLVTTSAIGIPAVGCYVTAEVITRARARKARSEC